MRIVVSGGGTGGHTSPALAIVEELRRRDAQLLVQWIGRKGGIEARVSKNAGIPFRAVPVEGWPRKTSPRMAWTLLKLAVGGLRAWAYLRSFRPQLVIGVGGYVSLPALYVAQRMGIPTMIHEQNKRLGMANRLLAPRATRIFLSYEETIGTYPADRAKLVGNPVRAGFVTPPEQVEAREALGLKLDVPVVLVVGGSQGAASINGAVAEALKTFERDEVQIIWMTGKGGADAARQAAAGAAVPVHVSAFIDDMVMACAAADVVVGRAGASSTAELAVMGKPAILVPYPHATDDHQTKNAEALVEAGAARLIADAALDGASLVEVLRTLLHDRDQLAAMAGAAKNLGKPLAAEAIVEEIMLTVFE
jgi:UDP-N-acetylglucosamine--N-acetylmuramyl-(pentapeptide) pyrophosphoryl-undecaprenol N-acetylglucosamine transferase